MTDLPWMKPACGKSGCRFCDPNGPSLRQLAVHIVPLEDDRRVVTLKQWSWRQTKPKSRVSHEEVLHRLVWHAGFVDAFVSVDSHLYPLGAKDAAEEWHGPFFRRDIRPEHFAALGKGEAQRALDGFLERPEYQPASPWTPPSPWAMERLDLMRHVVDLDEASAFALRMPKGARQHFLGTLCAEKAFDFFSELVLIDPERRLVSTLVLLIDE